MLTPPFLIGRDTAEQERAGLVIGLTGGFGTGKTTVADMFKGLGAKIIDADRIAHDVIRKEKDMIKKIVARFGRTILRKDGFINRRQLTEIAFSNKKNIKALCHIVHPEVKFRIAVILNRIRHSHNDAFLVLDAPLLIEAGMHNIVDIVIVVIADKAIQIQRCQQRTGLSIESIKRRIACQLPLKEKMQFAKFVIDNSGGRTQTWRQVKRIWAQVSKNWK